MDNTLTAWVQAAGSAASQGRWDEAEQLWQRVRGLDPTHPQALYSLGMHALQRGQLGDALQTLQLAHAAAPCDPFVLLAIANVLREQTDVAGELRALDAALILDPHFLAALLAKGLHLETQGWARLATGVYRNALKIAPAAEQWPPPLRAQLQHALDSVRRHSDALAAFLAERTGSALDALAPAEAERWREAGAIVSGQSDSYPSQCNQFRVPRLPAIPFFDRRLFDWVDALEAQTAAIRDELTAVLVGDRDAFRPYVAFGAGEPVHQWQELNHSTRWSSYFLWRNGEAVHAHQQRCPRTTQALRAVDLADIGGLCPNAMFSLLAPQTHIPPHHGETNARIVVHLPLVVPANCRFRVGFEQREWRVGEVLAFDDTIEHEARNDSDELRVVLIFDVWNPLLSAAEREMARAVFAAMHDFSAQG